MCLSGITFQQAASGCSLCLSINRSTDEYDVVWLNEWIYGQDRQDILSLPRRWNFCVILLLLIMLMLMPSKQSVVRRHRCK